MTVIAVSGEMPTGEAGREKASFSLRLRAWWEGRDVTDLQRGRAAADSEAGDDAGASDDAKDERDDAAGPQWQGPIPFRLRFSAWWEGFDLAQVLAKEMRRRAETETESDDKPKPAAKPVPAAPAPLAPTVEEEEVPGGYWSRARITACEMLFGDGNTHPGGAKRTVELIGSFGLKRDVHVLDFAAGLGGAARAIALAHEAWVTGYESDPALAAAAMEPQRIDQELNAPGTAKNKSNIKIMLGDKAHVEHGELADLDLKPHIFDCAYGREVMHKIEDKMAVFEKLFHAVKPKGLLMITDYVVVPGKENSEEISRWKASEPTPVFPLTLEQAKKLLIENGFELRVEENFTPRYRGDLFDDLSCFLKNQEGRALEPALVQPIREAVELWSARLAALDAGAIEVHKLVAVRLDG